MINYDVRQRVAACIRGLAALRTRTKKLSDQELVLDRRQNVLLKLEDAKLVSFLQAFNRFREHGSELHLLRSTKSLLIPILARFEAKLGIAESLYRGLQDCFVPAQTLINPIALLYRH